jgi:hypothetical protein
MRRISTIVAVSAFVSLGVDVSAFGQQGTGELRGRVTDEQSAVLPGVTVVGKNEGSGQFRESVTGAGGSFFMSALTPGSYEVVAQLTGFRKYQRGGVRVEVGKTQSIEVRLQVGGIEQEVTVTAESPLIDTTSKQLGGSVQTQELNDVPSLNRNCRSYLSLLPGITATLSTDSFGADSIRVNGQATQNAAYMLDGAGNNDNFNNGNGGAQARTPVEAIQEFQLLTRGVFNHTYRANGDLYQNYLSGQPSTVTLLDTPIWYAERLNAAFGVFGQDVWTLRRATFTIGGRWEYVSESVVGQPGQAGRFANVPAFHDIDVPKWKTFSPRTAAVFDLLGTGRTAARFGYNRFQAAATTTFASLYNPGLFINTVTASWTDLNGDDIAQGARGCVYLTPGCEINFATVPTNFGAVSLSSPDPAIERPYVDQFNVALAPS